MSEKLVTVGTFPDVSMAYLAKERLDEAGIPCFLAEENAGGWLLGVAATWPKILVAEADALRAIAVLESHFGPEEEGPEDSPPKEAITAREQFARFRDAEEPEEKTNVPPVEEEQPAADVSDVAESDARTAGRALVWLVLIVILVPLALGAIAILVQMCTWLFE
jgi:hypothetical protein